MTIDNCIDDLLMRGACDWLYAADVAWVAQSVGRASSATEIRDLSLTLIRELLDRGLMRIGDVTNDGFLVWHLSTDESVRRVEQEWLMLRRAPTIGELCWLESTKAGDALGERLLRERESRSD